MRVGGGGGNREEGRVGMGEECPSDTTQCCVNVHITLDMHVVVLMYI